MAEVDRCRPGKAITVPDENTLFSADIPPAYLVSCTDSSFVHTAAGLD
jgi:hypothetical protein